MSSYSKRREHSVIFAVTIGSLLEWYEIYLYIYWAPTIARLFFNHGDDIANLTNTFLLFAIGFIARPLGGIIFGRIGDLFGRKKSLILSISVMTLPTFLMGVLPTHEQIGLLAPISIVILRLMQSLPAGGELPGAFCYLYESTHPSHRRYMTSWGVVGNQIGIIISMVECFLLEHFMSPSLLESWGWRISFLVGSLIGLLGLFLRKRLHETPLFHEMESHHHHHIIKEPIVQVLKQYKDKIRVAIMLCILNSVGFYLISVLFPVYFESILSTSYDKNLIITILIILLSTIPLPLIGMLGDKISNKKLLVVSTICIIALLSPLYCSLLQQEKGLASVIGFVFILFFTCLSALIPYRFADLFPTHVRFTCVGISYNIVDGIIGGFSPVITLILIHNTGSQSYFYWMLFVTALISLYAFLKIHEKWEPSQHSDGPQ